MAKKPCLDCVLDVGGALVKLRHHLEKADKLFDEVETALVRSEPVMKDLGWRKMQYAAARERLLEARKAAQHVMVAHDHLRTNLATCDMEEPTDEQLVSRVGFANFR